MKIECPTPLSLPYSVDTNLMLSDTEDKTIMTETTQERERERTNVTTSFDGATLYELLLRVLRPVAPSEDRLSRTPWFRNPSLRTVVIAPLTPSFV